MATIEKRYKEQLSFLIAKGHARFGKVAIRRPYRDDEEGGDAGSDLNLETHPWLMNLPIGAASDLTAIASANSQATDEALDREEELSPELRMQPALQLGKEKRFTPPKLTPY